MTLDLSELDHLAPVKENSPMGKPLQILLTDIEEDPAQPRIEFNAQSMKKITDSVTETGVRTPISIRKHPRKNGKWILNYGARRYRGSILAGKTHIPAFIDETFTYYDQVIENTQRENLSPIELAVFIEKRLAAGDKKADIARKIGKDKTAITHYSALIDAPKCISELYVSGKCTSPTYLYEIRNLYGQFPEAVQAWCKSIEEVTRKTVTALATSLKDALGKSSEKMPAKAVLTKIKKPLLSVKYKSRAATLLLTHQAANSGYVVIEYCDTRKKEEVNPALVTITALHDKTTTK